MWLRLYFGPWWVRALALVGLMAAAFAAGVGLSWLIVDPARWGPWVYAAPAATAVVLGGLVAFAGKQTRDALAGALENLPAEHWQTAITAARGGPVPADGAVRAAALRIAQHYLRQTRRSRSTRWLLSAVMVLAVILQLLGVVFGGVDEPREVAVPVIIAISSVCTLFMLWYTPRTAERRVEVLLEN